MPSANDQLFTIAEIARHFSLPESTCRYYCKRFSDYIPSVGEGRRRRYRQGTIDVITTILEEMKKSRTASAVDDALAIRFPRNAISLQRNAQNELAEPPLGETFPPLALEFMERQTMALEGIAKMLNVLSATLCANRPLSLGDQSVVQNLQKEVDKLRILLDASEKNQQADLEQLRMWMGRLYRKISRNVA